MKRHLNKTPSIKSISALWAFTASLLASLALATEAGAQTSGNAPAASEATSQQETVTLSPFEVSASSNVGYGAETTSSSGRIVQAYIDVPQTVNVVTAEFMQDFDIVNTREALATVPGVDIGSSINNGANSIRGVQVNAFYIDGLQGTAGSTTSNTGGGSMVMPTAFYDRLEVVKGPSSAAFGAGESGGIINFILKSPQGINRTDISVGVGAYNNFRASIDSQGVLNDKLSYRVVMDEESGDSSVHYVHTSSTGAQLAVKYNIWKDTTIQWITSAEKFTTPAYRSPYYDSSQESAVATLTVFVPGFTYNPNQTIPAATLPYGFISHSDPGATVGWMSDNNEYFRSELSLTHNFTNNVSIRNAVMIDDAWEQQHIDAGESTAINSPIPSYNPGYAPGQYGAGRVLIDWPIQSRGLRDALDFNASFDLLGGRWTTTAGGEAHRTWNFEDFQLGLTYLPPGWFGGGKPLYVNVYDPGTIGNYNQYVNQLGHDTAFPYHAAFDAEQNYGYGYYLQQQASYFHGIVSLLGAWRNDYLDQSVRNYTNNSLTKTGMTNYKGAWRGAITVKPVKWLSVYGLYSEHKDPTQLTGKWIIEGAIPASVVPDPGAVISYQPSGVLIEGGAKASLFDGKVTASVAVYHDITSGSILDLYAPNGPVFVNGAAQAYSEATITGTNIHGVEASISGTVMDRLVLTANYSMTKGTQPGVATPTTNNPALNVPTYLISHIEPPNVVNVFGKYDFGDLHGDGLFATFGLNCYSPYNYNYQPIIDYAGKYWTFRYPKWQYDLNVGLGYKWAHGKQKLYLSADNITDQLIDVGTGTGGNDAAINGRNFWLTYTLSF